MKWNHHQWQINTTPQLSQLRLTHRLAKCDLFLAGYKPLRSVGN